jgi:hypothetical protein
MLLEFVVLKQSHPSEEQRHPKQGYLRDEDNCTCEVDIQCIVAPIVVKLGLRFASDSAYHCRYYWLKGD